MKKLTLRIFSPLGYVVSHKLAKMLLRSSIGDLYFYPSRDIFGKERLRELCL